MKLSSAPAENRPVIIFDGYCNFCCWAARFISRRDPGRRFVFIAMQDELAARLLEKHGLGGVSGDTLVLIDRGMAYTKSTAALMIARRLSGLWPVLYAFIIVPKPVRDFVYGIVSTYRYRIFGRRKSCFVAPREDEDELPHR